MFLVLISQMGTLIFPGFHKRVCSLFRKLNRGALRYKSSSSIPKQWKPFDEEDVTNHVSNIFLCSPKEAAALVDSVKEEFSKDRCGRIEILRALRKKGFNINNVIGCRTVMKQPLGKNSFISAILVQVIINVTDYWKSILNAQN